MPVFLPHVHKRAGGYALSVIVRVCVCVCVCVCGVCVCMICML